MRTQASELYCESMSRDRMEQKVTGVAHAFGNILDIMEIDWRNDPQTEGTPRRFAKMLFEACSGRYESPPVITTFPNEKKNDELLVVGPLRFDSLCAHHFVPIIGNAYIAYVPGDRLAGLSKFSRVVKYFGNRPQIQEGMNEQVYNYLSDCLCPKNLAVILEGIHFCMYWRGVKDHSSFSTSKLSDGILQHAALRAEVMQLVDARRKPILP